MKFPNISENLALIAPDSVTTDMLSDLSTALDELAALADRIADPRKETLDREVVLLKAILEMVASLVSLLNRDCEQYYHRENVILTKVERAQLENGYGIFSDYMLILYENCMLVRVHCYGECSEGLRPGWKNTYEDALTSQAAITAFGLAAISGGLLNVLSEASSIAILKEKSDGRLAALTKALEALL